MERYVIFGFVALAFMVGIFQCTGPDTVHFARSGGQYSSTQPAGGR
jgi:hypothetical protein